MWCVGEVIEAADGKTTKRSPRCLSTLPWGAVRIKWPADDEFDEEEHYTWTILKPDDFNHEVNLGWRYDKTELAKMKATGNK